jgi:hypothetical protein
MKFALRRPTTTNWPGERGLGRLAPVELERLAVEVERARQHEGVVLVQRVLLVALDLVQRHRLFARTTPRRATAPGSTGGSGRRASSLSSCRVEVVEEVALAVSRFETPLAVEIITSFARPRVVAGLIAV